MTEKTDEAEEEKQEARANRWIPQRSEMRYLKRFKGWGKEGELPRYAREYAQRGSDPEAHERRVHAKSVAAPQYNGHSEDPLEKRLYRPSRAKTLYQQDADD